MCKYYDWLAAAALTLVTTTAALAQPTNDDFDAAVAVSSLPFSQSVDTTEATVAGDDPFASCVGPTATVWYRFTPTVSQQVETNTFGSDYDTTLTVWTGSRGNLTEIACNDDFNDLQSRVRFDAIAGETYYVMAGTCCGGDGSGGSLQISFIEGPPPLQLSVTLNSRGTINRYTGVATIRGTVICSRLASVNVDGQLLQKFLRGKVKGYFGSYIETCDGATPWEAQVDNGLISFGTGRADVSVNANAYEESVSDGAFGRVQLRR